MKAFLNRLKFSLQGLAAFFSKETNGQIQLVIAGLVITAGFVLHINKTEWIAILAAIAFVLSLEMVNSAIEKLCDRLHPDWHASIKFIKDVAAGAVLWAAIFSAIIGLIIFLPKVLAWV